MVYINNLVMFEKENVCIECDGGFQKILKINQNMNSIPFQIDTGKYHRNLQTPYFVCGTVSNAIDNCEYYLDSNNGKSNL